MARKKKFNNRNAQFIQNVDINNLTYLDYLNRFKKVALSIFEWVNLPSSMNEQYLEKCLYYYGQAGILKDKNYGFINTQVCDNGNLNIYGFPLYLHCYSYQYSTNRKLYSGLDWKSEEERKEKETSSAILVQNNYDRMPTAGSMELFAYRLYQAERTIDTNLIAQKTPVVIILDENQRLTMENLFSQFEGNKPVIFGDKQQLSENVIKTLNTEAPYVIDKVTEYKKEIWNEALTFLGINNINIDKKERLITDEANNNNELINLNLQSYLIPRQKACEQFNEKFGLIGTDKEISVRVRSDLHNIIKNAESVVSDYGDLQELQQNLISLPKNLKESEG